MFILKKGQTLGDYTVLYPLKQSLYAQSYKVKNSKGQICFLKLIEHGKLHVNQWGSRQDIVEITMVREITHPNMCRGVDSGEILLDGRKCSYIIFDFINGETILEYIMRAQRCDVSDAKIVIRQVLDGLHYLHSLPRPIIHNELTLSNVMLDLSGEMPVAKIIDFGYAQYADESYSRFRLNGLNPFYLAPEVFEGDMTAGSDLYSVGVMIYYMVFGKLPWFVDFHNGQGHEAEDIIRRIALERSTPLEFPDSDRFQDPDKLVSIIKKALAPKPEDRFTSVKEFIAALDGEATVIPETRHSAMAQNAEVSRPREKKGNGFEDIAGMDDLKEQLRFDVIDLLEHPQEYKRHGLTMPNGMLLYGPPGCGKTFFALKFAEETGYHFMKVVTSDIASIYAHGTQEKIRALFDRAKSLAPTILYFDEINSMVPCRDSEACRRESSAGEVNEFLSQLDNIGRYDVFVIASTNYPHLMDAAVLRAGRLEQKFYVGPPDQKAREAMFHLYLTQRPHEKDIDFCRLAELTEGFVSADIKYLIDKASRHAIRERLPAITRELMDRVILGSKPTVSREELQKHERIRCEFNGEYNASSQRRIGFLTE